MSEQNFIKDALNEYDKASDITEILYGVKYKITNTTSEHYRSKIEFFDASGEILESEFEILGLFYEKYNLWCWSWSMPELLKSQNSLSRDILRYSLELNSNMMYTKSILSTSRGIINDQTQIDINVAVFF